MTRSALRAAAWIAGTALALGMGACGKGSKQTGFNGRFRGTVGNATEGKEITLSQSGDTVKLVIDGEEVQGRLVSPTRAEGSRTDAEGTFRFALDLQGNDRISATFGIEVAGQRLDFPPTTLERVVEAAPSSGGGGGGSREAALVGHWRHTEVLGSGDSHFVTDTHFVLEADGTFVTWSKSAGMGSASESERTRGEWKTEGGSLHMRDEGGGWMEVGRYAVSGDNLMLTGGGGKRVYQRV